MLKFADDAKLAQAVHNLEGRHRVRIDLLNLFEWSEKWQMKFYLDKCKIMHIWNTKNAFDRYRLGGKILQEVDEENYLMVTFNNKFKADKECARVVKKAKQILCLIYTTFECKHKIIVKQLYKSLVRLGAAESYKQANQKLAIQFRQSETCILLTLSLN